MMDMKDALGWVLAVRSQPAFNGARAALARARMPQFRSAAIAALRPDIREYISSAHPNVANGLLLAMSTAAATPNGKVSHARLGTTFHRVDSARLGTLLSNLVTQSQENAGRLLHGLVVRAVSDGKAVDYFDLANILMYWDKGTYQDRVQHRSRLLNDYYSPRKEKADDRNNEG